MRLQELIANPDPTVREAIAGWAGEYTLFDDPQVFPAIDDPVVWEALSNLSMADMRTTDRPYLYGPTDFGRWLDQVPSD